MTRSPYMQQAPRPCKVPACTEYATTTTAYCTEHTRSKEQRKQATTSAAYRRPEYQRARRAILAKHGTQCWACSHPATSSDPATVHHIDGNPYNNRLQNLAILHRTCHARLEREIDANRRGPITRALQRTLDARTHR